VLAKKSRSRLPDVVYSGRQHRPYNAESGEPAGDKDENLPGRPIEKPGSGKVSLLDFALALRLISRHIGFFRKNMSPRVWGKDCPNLLR
jgi:hypothetical protein